MALVGEGVVLAHCFDFLPTFWKICFCFGGMGLSVLWDSVARALFGSLASGVSFPLPLPASGRRSSLSARAGGSRGALTSTCRQGKGSASAARTGKHFLRHREERDGEVVGLLGRVLVR